MVKASINVYKSACIKNVFADTCTHICEIRLMFKGKENGKIRMKVSVIEILYNCSMCMH